MTIRNKFSLIGITALLVCIAVIFFSREKSQNKKVLLHAEAVQNSYGWGYNILANDKVYIKQEFIPALSGRNGFQSSDDALKVANLVIQRIRSNQPFAISTGDLDSLGVLKVKSEK